MAALGSAPSVACEPPIRAELVGSDTATALGVTTRCSAPVLQLCRLLIEAGADPARPIEVFRGDVLCLRVRTVGKGARLELDGDRFRCRSGAGTASLARLNGPAAP
jgi:hypothetical protein